MIIVVLLLYIDETKIKIINLHKVCKKWRTDKIEWRVAYRHYCGLAGTMENKNKERISVYKYYKSSQIIKHQSKIQGIHTK